MKFKDVFAALIYLIFFLSKDFFYNVQSYLLKHY